MIGSAISHLRPGNDQVGTGHSLVGVVCRVYGPSVITPGHHGQLGQGQNIHYLFRMETMNTIYIASQRNINSQGPIKDVQVLSRLTD